MTEITIEKNMPRGIHLRGAGNVVVVTGINSYKNAIRWLDKWFSRREFPEYFRVVGGNHE